MQSSKVIDVTRSFIPIDPNAYPETMHGTGREDDPEKRVPAVPYAGHNFLPTAQGYKSYFGLNLALDISTLPPVNKPDHVFMYQTEAFVNYIIALCDTGIWIKNTATTGAWFQLKLLIAPAALAFAEWTFCTIKNKMYFFRNNNTVYYRLETDLAETLGIKLYDVTPTFITLNTQLGMFRLGSRLGFWDTNNAVSWSSPDSLSDFTPAVLTGANVTTFNSIVGKISAIRPHGSNVIVYASKSVVLLAIQPGEVFLAKAVPVLIGTGVPYLRQSVEAVPNTTHFCYTDSGIYKIENGKPEVIVPEVYDYLKTYTAQPAYLKLLQGRYLCFEILDVRAIAGKAQFSKKVIPPTNVMFAGDSVALTDIETGGLPANMSLCDLMNLIASDYFIDQKDAFKTGVAGYPSPSVIKPGTSVEPIYTCYLSNAAGPQEFVWGSIPCGAAKVDGTGLFKPSPTGDEHKLSTWSTNATNKTAKTGAQSWTDGKWTMTRFVQWQSTIWTLQENRIKAFLRKLEGHIEVNTKTTAGQASCTPNPNPTPAECVIGEYPSTFSPHRFGMNKCSFWLTRYALTKATVKNIVTNVIACDITHITNLQPTAWRVMQNGNPLATDYGSANAAAATWNYSNAGAPYSAAVRADIANLSVTVSQDLVVGGVTHNITGSTGLMGGSPGGDNGVFPVWVKAPDGNAYTYDAAGNTMGGNLVLPIIGATPILNPSIKIETQYANNTVTESEVGVWGVETAYCEITGYTYVNTAGSTVTLPANACTFTKDRYPYNGNADTGIRQVPVLDTRPVATNPQDGSVCSTNLGDLNDESLLIKTGWPDQTVVYPKTSFLVQIGSIAPKHATRYGLFVYDLHLQKWGKAKITYKELLDYQPVNTGTNSPVTFDVFGILAGIIDALGVVYLFDNEPIDSRITWGKFGYYRHGVTDMQAVRVDFSTISAGIIEVQASLDGVSLGEELITTKAFNGAKSVTIHPNYSGKWHNVTLTGKWDVSYMEVIGLPKGRR